MRVWQYYFAVDGNTIEGRWRSSSLSRHTEKDIYINVLDGICNFANNFVGEFCIIMANFTQSTGATLMKMKQEPKPLQDCRAYSKFSRLVSVSSCTTNNRPPGGERQLDQYN